MRDKIRKKSGKYFQGKNEKKGEDIFLGGKKTRGKKRKIAFIFYFIISRNKSPKKWMVRWRLCYIFSDFSDLVKSLKIPIFSKSFRLKNAKFLRIFQPL